MNVAALIAVIVIAAVFLSIVGALYNGASRSYNRGEIGVDGILFLRWAILGFIVLYSILTLTAFLV